MSKSAFFLSLPPVHQKQMREVALFMMVGLLNTAIDFAVLNLLAWFTHLHSGLWLLIFSCLSFFVAVVNSYILNSRLTFRDSLSGGSLKFVRFVGVNLTGMAINGGIVWLLAPQIGKMLSPIAAINVSKGLATLVSLCWNYLIVRRWIFKTQTLTLNHGSLAAKNLKNLWSREMKNPNTRLIKFLAVIALVVALLLTAVVRTILQTPVIKSSAQALAAKPASQQAGIKAKVWATGSDWPTYLHDIQRTSSSGETDLSPANVGQLTEIWSFKTGNNIAASATVVNGTAYFGSWDGYEYALDAMTGAFKWKTYLGRTVGRSDCNPPSAGVTSSATALDGVVYVGGGDSYWYALSAKTGSVLWKVFTGDNSAAGGHYNWSSPLIYNGYAYIGIASEGDCPLIPGQLLKVSLSTHQVVATYNAVGPGEIGGGIWTSPSIDTATNTIYIAAATETLPNQNFAQSIYSLDASTLALKGLWKPPESDFIQDSDFDTTPILFTDAAGRPLVASINKNGKVYVLNRTNLSAGPVWTKQIVLAGDCPLCENSSVSSGTFGQGTLYLAGANSNVNGVDYRGSVHALDPATGKYLWQRGEAGPVFGALAYTNGMLIVGDGGVLQILDATTGDVLYSYQTGGERIYTAPSISHGVIYVGSSDGYEHAFGLPNVLPPTPAADSDCPRTWFCQDIGNPLITGSDSGSGSSYTVAASGAGVGGVSDELRFVSQNVKGDAQVSAKVVSSQVKNGLVQAGLMLRQSGDPGSPYYAVFLTAGTGVVAQYRTGFGTDTLKDVQLPAATAPLYLEIQRSGDQFQAATSIDGIHYTLVPGSTATVVMPTTVAAGLAVSSGNDGLSSTVIYKAVSLGLPKTAPDLPPALTPCPAGWECADLGNPAILGKQALNGGTWTLQGGGTDLWGTEDQSHFVWQTLSGSGSIKARVFSPTLTDPWAKAGIMLRQNTDAGSVYYGIIVMPGASGNGIEVQSRSNQGLLTVGNGFVPGQGPIYLKIERVGNDFTAYTSTDGVTWTAIQGSTVTLAMSNTVLAGLLVTSHNVTTLTTAKFDSLSIG